MVLVNALYGLGQLLSSLDSTMNIVSAFKPSGAKGFPGTNQVEHQTNQVVHTTPKMPTKGTVYTVILHLPLAKALSWHAVTVPCPKGCSTWGQVELL